MQVEGQHESSLLDLMATGARVRNAYPIYPQLGDSLAKVRLTPDGLGEPHDSLSKVIRQWMWMRPISLLAG